MVDVAKELQKLKAMVNQKQTTAIFSNKSNESTKLANGDTELYINDMTRKFSFTRAGVMNPVMIDPKNKSLENVEYLNGTKVEDITSSAIAIAALERDVNDHEVRISKVEADVAVVDELDERLTDCEIKDVEQDVKIAEVESEVNDRYTKKEVDDKFENFIIKDHTHTKFDNDLTINGDVMFGQQSSDVEVFNFLKHEYLYMDPGWGTSNNKIALTIAVKNDLFEITTAHVIYIGVEALIDGKVCSWKARYDLSQHSTMPSLVIMPCTSHTIEPNEIRFVPKIPGLPNYTFVVQDIDAPYNQYPITVTELRVCKTAGYPVKIWKEGNVDIGGNLTVDGTLTADYLGQNLQKAIVNLIYPIGALYTSFNNISPAIIFGVGTWAQIIDKFLYCTNSSGQSGGSKKITVANLPSHNHTFTGTKATGTFGNMHGKYQESWYSGPFSHDGEVSGEGGYNSSSDNDNYKVTWNYTPAGSISSTGSGTDYMPPYITVYAWRRTG